MRTLYIDCSMGCAGDMLTAALLELHPDKDDFLRRMNAALGGKAVLSASPDSKCGLRGTHVTVLINGDEEGEATRHHHARSGRRKDKRRKAQGCGEKRGISVLSRLY